MRSVTKNATEIKAAAGSVLSNVSLKVLRLRHTLLHKTELLIHVDSGLENEGGLPLNTTFILTKSKFFAQIIQEKH